MISPQYVDGLELRIRELEDELAEWKAKGSRGQIAQWHRLKRLTNAAYRAPVERVVRQEGDRC